MLLSRGCCSTNSAEPAADEIAWIEERYGGNIRILPRRVALIDDPIRREQAGTLVAALASDGPPGTLGLFDMRRRTLSLDAALAALSDDNRALTDRMNEGVAAVVSRSQLIAANASEAADSAVEFGGLTVLLQIVLFIAIAGAIAWLYVHRNLVHRLTALHRVMQSLAAGRLDVAVPTGGSDELSDMADTVRVFRDQGIVKRQLEEEREQTNAELRQHKEDLERLVKERTAQLTEANVRLVEEVRNHDRARDRAEQASRAKSEFLATMSHEIRTPMNGVLGMLRLMSDGPLNERQQQQVRVMRSSSEILLGILNDILDYSRVESGEIEVDNAVFDLHELVEDIVVLMQGRAREKDLALDLTIDEGVPAAVTGDRQKLSQVLLNLLGNGIKFTDRGGVTLALSSGPDPDNVCLSVLDSGLGIAEPDVAHLFEPFYQAASSRRRGQQTGTGLGLAISKRLVTAMGGLIALETEPGSGSCFSVTLPLPQSEAAAQPPVEAVPHWVTGPDRALSVLIVEDNVVNAMVVEAFVARMGHKPLVAPTAEEGLELLEDRRSISSSWISACRVSTASRRRSASVPTPTPRSARSPSLPCRPMCSTAKSPSTCSPGWMLSSASLSRPTAWRRPSRASSVVGAAGAMPGAATGRAPTTDRSSIRPCWRRIARSSGPSAAP